MNQKNMSMAQAFYGAMGEKNLEGMESYLHRDAVLVTPLSTLTGRQSYLESVKSFMPFFKTLTLRVVFGQVHQAMVVYDIEYAEALGRAPAAALMTFQEGLIIRNELFHDTSPFQNLSEALLA